MPDIASFAEAKEYLARYYADARTIYTLDNILALLNYLDNPQEKFKVVHVAGTSGKTSTAYYMATLLTAAAKKTGLTISPHVDQINERVQINMEPIAEAEFCAKLSTFLEVVDKSQTKPSWFEVMVAFAYWYFAEQKVDYAVVEVGLGGLKDGTNVIKRSDKICMITDIGLDHIGILGDTIEKIAVEKAGIIQDGNTVFCYQQANGIMEVLHNRCKEKNAVLKTATSIDTDFKKRNLSLANEAYSFLENRDKLSHLTSEVLSKTLQIYIPGRMDVRQIDNKTLVMDGAHNDQKVKAFVSSFRQQFPGVKPAILVAFKEGKEFESMIPLLSSLSGRVITTTFTSAQDMMLKSMDSQLLAEAFKRVGTEAENIADQSEAYKALLKGDEKVVIVTGSFYLLGQIRNNEHLV